LAEALEVGGYAVEVFAAGVHPREDHVELIGNAFLLVERREAQLAIKEKR